MRLVWIAALPLALAGAAPGARPASTPELVDDPLAAVALVQGTSIRNFRSYARDTSASTSAAGVRGCTGSRGATL